MPYNIPKGTISQSLRGKLYMIEDQIEVAISVVDFLSAENGNAPPSAASVITLNQPVAEASSNNDDIIVDVMPQIEDARKRMEILDAVNKRFLESYSEYII
ncbi:hypothetical protein G6F42_027562 [Rhizopus arrhizus]|nr:hypothetical protein G6F42_027562 [Rhizopus arrhizus]